MIQEFLCEAVHTSHLISPDSNGLFFNQKNALSETHDMVVWANLFRGDLLPKIRNETVRMGVFWG